MNIGKRAANLAADTGVILEIVGNNIGGYNITYPGDAITSVTRGFTPADLEAGELERWFKACYSAEAPTAPPEEKKFKPRRRASGRR